MGGPLIDPALDRFVRSAWRFTFVVAAVLGTYEALDLLGLTARAG